MPEQPASNVPSQAAYPASPAKGKPRVVEGSDYLRNNPRSQEYSYRTGSVGEQRVVDRMLEVLDAQWTIFRNVDLGNRDGDIDVVLVGPGGIWAVEVKNYKGTFRVVNGSWYYETSNGHMERMRRGPGAQVRTNASQLCEYLKERGVTHGKYVDCAVIMSGNAPVEVLSTGTDIWMLDQLDVQLASLRSRKRYQPDHVRHVVSVLERACSPETRLH
ncbi:MAG: NERD domain-containing protein [Chloroflexota bacterium]|nr:NERD domain-containing protein [Chloroflexota bacterium]MDQ5865726.1 NERD domain-containing protein [Chloroflexota bacterium]